MNREITIADALEIISRIDNLREMRHQILKLRSKINWENVGGKRKAIESSGFYTIRSRPTDVTIGKEELKLQALTSKGEAAESQISTFYLKEAGKASAKVLGYSLVGLDESVGGAWGNVQTAYQLRADLIPNLVATVKAYSDYEGEVLTDITEARAGVDRAKTPKEFEEADAQLTSTLSRLLVIVEAYPNLKANENYLDLQVQLEGTENRIKIERDNYNKAVKVLNTKVRKFPSNIIAGMFNFEQKDYFESDSGSENAPDVGELFN